MKKLLAVLVLIIGIAAVVLTRCGGGLGLGLGFGTGKGDGDGNKAINVSDEKVEDSEAPEADNSDESTDESESEKTILKVTVVENDYFYENEKIRLNTLMDRIKETDGDYVVEIKDEQASKNAYEALIEELKEDGIAYTEK